MNENIRFNLNDKPVVIAVDGDRTLLWVLRTDLDLTGAKFGCGEGLCGACTVLINNEAVPACQTPATDPLQRTGVSAPSGRLPDDELSRTSWRAPRRS